MIHFLIYLFYFSNFLLADPILNSNKTLIACPAQNNFEHCSKYTNDIDFYLNEWKLGRGTKKVWEFINSACLDARVCFYNMQCIEASYQQEMVIEKCKKFEMDRFEVTPCVEKFVSEVYKNNFNCSEIFYFLSKNLTTQREAFTSGESCALQIVNTTCSKQAIFYINTQYLRFVNTMTIPAPVDKCVSIYDETVAIRCKLELEEMARQINETRLGELFNDEKRNQTVERCASLKNCMTEVCHFAQTSKSTEICDLKNLNHTNPTRTFVGCYFHIGLDVTIIPEDLVDKNYMKTVMEEECGRKAVENFEEDWKKYIGNSLFLYSK